MVHVDKDFLRNTTYKKELEQNKLGLGRCLLALLLATNIIVIGFLAGAASVNGFVTFLLEMLVYTQFAIAGLITYDEFQKWEERRYIAETIDWVVSVCNHP